MSEQQDKQDSETIELVNDRLERALKLCHSLVDDYRSKLASNLATNEPAPANDEEED